MVTGVQRLTLVTEALISLALASITILPRLSPVKEYLILCCSAGVLTGDLLRTAGYLIGANSPTDTTVQSAGAAAARLAETAWTFTKPVPSRKFGGCLFNDIVGPVLRFATAYGASAYASSCRGALPAWEIVICSEPSTLGSALVEP